MKTVIRILMLLFSITVTAQNTYLHCGKLIDTKSGKVLTEKTVVVFGNKIITVENGYVDPQDSEDTVIDLKSKTVMPGLIDMHVHIEHETNPKSYLENYTLNDADVAFGSVKYAEVTLMSVTLTNAMILKMEDQLGQIKVDYLADIIAVDDDPTQNITTMENVTFVMKNEVIYKK